MTHLIRLNRIVLVAAAVVALFFGVVFITPRADTQSQTQLVPLVTDQTPLALSNVFGPVTQSAVNQAGDYAFIGQGASGVYYWAAGAGAITPVLDRR